MVKTFQVCVLAVWLAAGGALRAGAAERVGTPVVSGEADRAASIPFEVVRQPDGGIQILVHGPGVEFRKTSYRGGRFLMGITTADDRLSIAAGEETIVVDRNGKSASAPMAGGSREAVEPIRQLLASAPSVGALHEFAASLDKQAQESPAVYAILMADAFVSMLKGDTEAARRLVHRVRDARVQSSRDRGVGVRPAEWVDCWVGYSGSLMGAFGDLFSCVQETSWLGDVGLLGCEAVYFLRAEGYWFEYLSCSAFPLRLA